MIRLGPEGDGQGILFAARMICAAARTAPKGKGADLLLTAVVTGAHKSRLSRRMRRIAKRDKLDFFKRDADGVDRSPVVVLLATRKEPLGLMHCGYCGFTH